MSDNASTLPDAQPVHVVTMGFSGFGGRPDWCRSATLAGLICEQILALVPTWRSARFNAAQLEALRREYQLRGLVIWLLRNPKVDAVVPPPLEVPIEPLELDEGRSALHELPGIQGDGVGAKPLRSSRARRLLVRLGLPLVIILPQLFNGITQMVFNRNVYVYWTWGLMIGALIVATILIWWLSDQWLIVPGGVLIRKSFVGKVGQSLRLFTPADSLLLIRPHVQGVVQLELWRGGKCFRRRATPLELAALLAAWQSPLPPPSMDRLSDWW